MSEIAEIEISEFVQDYLDPISGNSPAGNEANNEQEYFILNMEIPKTTPDYKKCIELSNIILKEKSKDIKIATWLCFALFRTEKMKGLIDGLNIIYHLLKKYENDLYPSNIVYRSKAIQFLNQPRFFKLIEREAPEISNARDFIEADIILKGIVDECSRLFPQNTPALRAIIEVMQSHVETASNLLNPKLKVEKTPEQPEKKINAVIKPVVEDSSPTKIVEKPAQQIVPVKESVAQPLKIGTENDGVIQLRQLLSQFYEYTADGIKKEKVPESFFIFGIARQLQWGKLLRPPETDSVTQIEPPNAIMRGNLKKWFEMSDWDTLIPRIEINFLKADSVFPYWLDTQRYVTKALESKGGNYILASEEIKRQLANLLNSIPDFYKMKFKDKQTSFADEETVKWILDEVISSVKKSDSKDQVTLPPIMGEEYEKINSEYEKACSELPKNIEINITSMQKAIEADDRRKGKFLRRLNLASYCLQAKLYELSKVHLGELILLIEEYNLALWESALCTAVWQTMYLVNKELISGTHDKELKISLEKEQKGLFNKVAKYDSIIAIKLQQKK